MSHDKPKVVPINESVAFGEFMRAFVTDEKGRRVLAGLTPEETTELLVLRKKWLDDHQEGVPSPFRSKEEHLAARKRERELHDKHEAARVKIVAAEYLTRAKNKD